MIVAGYRLPFFPMRPTQGTVLDSDRIKLAIQRLIDGWTVQLKLNGDRAIVAVDESKRVFVFNRHGSKYEVTEEKLNKFLTIGTVHRGTALRIEGVVLKEPKSRYIPLGAESQNSPSWFKWKFAAY